MAGKYLRGAFIQFTETFPVPIPNVIIFQYNPETMTRTWTPATTRRAAPGDHASDPLAITGDPRESFSFTLAMDANEMIADGDPVAATTGVYPRLAALEMLLFPTAAAGAGLVGSITAALGIVSAASKPSGPIPAAQLPMVFFVWGPGRIVPVRVRTLTITEKLYDATQLNPTHVEAQIGLEVLTKEDIRYVEGSLGDLGKAADTCSQRLRQTLALANSTNAGQSIIGMLPV
jgi:hypothetical protein